MDSRQLDQRGPFSSLLYATIPFQVRTELILSPAGSPPFVGWMGIAVQGRPAKPHSCNTL